MKNMSTSKRLLKCLYEKKYAELPSSLDGKFDIKIAYQVAMEICEARDLQGEKLEGIKVGFTNMNIWKQYNVNVPIFGPMYSSTVINYNNKFNVNRYLEPKFEPEIYFKLKKYPNSKMTDLELLDCCSHFGVGIEIVQSIFEGWKFSAPDAIAAFGLHGQFKKLKEINLAGYSEGIEALGRSLSNFSLTLVRNGEVVEKGHARNILGKGPVESLRAYVLFCEKYIKDWLLLDKPITTGTITNAYDVHEGEEYLLAFDNIQIEAIKTKV